MNTSKKTADYRGSKEKFSNRNDYADYMIEIFGAESLLDQLVAAMGDDEAFKNFDYIAQMNDINFNEDEENTVESSKKKTAEYQGYTNHPTWAVALHLDNEQGTQEMMLEWANEAIEASTTDENTKEGIWTADDAAKFNLADRLKEFVEENNPCTEPDMYSDIMNGVLGDINYNELATKYIELAIENKK